MSTATARPVGDNEFPVLLRLPDLHAPVFSAPPAIASGAKAKMPATPAPVEIVSIPLEKTEPVVAPAVSAPAAPPVAKEAQPPKQTKEPISAAVTPTATPSVGVAASAAPPTPPTTANAAPASTRAERPLRPLATPAQWNLVKQFATGGVLVGGLALTYMLIMGGGSDDPPEHIQTAETTLDPPVIETGEPTTPTVVRASDHQSPHDVAHVPPPPAFTDWNAAPRGPSHIEVAEAEPPKMREAGRPEINSIAPPDRTPRVEVVEERAAPEKYQGRIGPESSASAPPGVQYPTTDPRSFMYRPAESPEASRTRAARLEGTIAPPPLRR